jgi:hypothetical protein
VTVPVVALALLFWVGVFVIYFTAAKTTPLEFFLGRYELPPSDLGAWHDVHVGADGLMRQERCLLPDGAANAGYLLHQVRYRDPTTRAIVRVEPERRVPRRRTGRVARSER